MPLPDGELVEFVPTWEERGISHACHQAITEDTVFCGGRWPASLRAEMAASEQAARREQARASG